MKTPIIRAVVQSDSSGPYWFSISGNVLDDSGKIIPWGFSTSSEARHKQELEYIRSNYEAQIVTEYRTTATDYGH